MIPPRLRDAPAPKTRKEAEAVALLAACEPQRTSAARKQRVWAALQAAAPGAGASRAGERVVLRPAVVIAFVLGAATAASASLGRGFIARVAARVTGDSPAVSGPAPAQAPTGRRRGRAQAGAPVQPGGVIPGALPAAEAPVVAPPIGPAASAVQATAAPSRTMAASPAREPTSRAGSGAAAVRSPARPGEDPTLVAAAVRALRREGDAPRAAKLLDEYLRRYPEGALAEEALALSIEAADVRGDPRGRALASRYLARFPSGRFGDVARRALARTVP